MSIVGIFYFLRSFLGAPHHESALHCLVSLGRAINGRTYAFKPLHPSPFSHLLSWLSCTVCESVIKSKIRRDPPPPSLLYVLSICSGRKKTRQLTKKGPHGLDRGS